MRIKNLSVGSVFRIYSVRPQLTKVINWLLRNQFENVIKFTQLIISRKKKEQQEDETRIKEQVKLMLEQVKGRTKEERRLSCLKFAVVKRVNWHLTSKSKEERQSGYSFQPTMYQKTGRLKQQRL